MKAAETPDADALLVAGLMKEASAAPAPTRTDLQQKTRQRLQTLLPQPHRTSATDNSFTYAASSMQISVVVSCRSVAMSSSTCQFECRPQLRC